MVAVEGWVTTQAETHTQWNLSRPAKSCTLPSKIYIFKLQMASSEATQRFSWAQNESLPQDESSPSTQEEDKP